MKKPIVFKERKLLSTLICSNCQGHTHPTVSQIFPIDYKKPLTAHFCYAKCNNKIWEKGCSYDKADIALQHYVDKLINSNAFYRVKLIPPKNKG